MNTHGLYLTAHYYGRDTIQLVKALRVVSRLFGPELGAADVTRALSKLSDDHQPVRLFTGPEYVCSAAETLLDTLASSQSCYVDECPVSLELTADKVQKLRSFAFAHSSASGLDRAERQSVLDLVGDLDRALGSAR